DGGSVAPVSGAPQLRPGVVLIVELDLRPHGGIATVHVEHSAERVGDDARVVPVGPPLRVVARVARHDLDGGPETRAAPLGGEAERPLTDVGVEGLLDLASRTIVAPELLGHAGAVGAVTDYHGRPLDAVRRHVRLQAPVVERAWDLIPIRRAPESL